MPPSVRAPAVPTYVSNRHQAMTAANEDKTIAFHDATAALEGERRGAAAAAPRARLLCLDTSQIDGPLPGNGQIHLFAGAEQIVGRGDTCTFTVPSRKLSRQHARLFAGDGIWGIEDLNSTNGVQVNKLKVKTAWLSDGDEVRIGPIPFRFEVERTDVTAPVRAAAAASTEEASADRTMMIGSIEASKAVIEAAQRKEEPPPPPPPRARTAAQKPKGGSGKLAMIGLAVVVLGGAVAGGVVYYPTFKENQEVGALVARGQQTISGIIARSRELGNATPNEEMLKRDLQALQQPEVTRILQELNNRPGRIDLANLYARAQVLQFERVFTKHFNGDQIQEAGSLAGSLKRQLDEVSSRLPPDTDSKSYLDLTEAIRVAELAGILVTCRQFTRKYPNVSRTAAAPTAEELTAIEQRKADFDRLHKLLNKVLSGDYLLFNSAVKDSFDRDMGLISRWREFVRTGF